MARTFRSCSAFTVDEVFGGWTQAQAEHFDDGAIYDRLVAAGQALKARSHARAP